MLDVVVVTFEDQLSKKKKHSMLPLLIFLWLENKLITVDPKANSTAY